MPVRLCIIGAGHMGKIHARKLAAMKDVSLIGIVDVNMPASQELAGQLGVSATDSLDSFFDQKLDGAIIASTTDSHYMMARALMKKGIHVFLEKPITAEIKEAEELITLSRNKGLVLQVGHLERFNPPFRKAIHFIKKPLTIETRRTSGFTGRSTDIDVVLDLMIHDIDLVMSIKKDIPITHIEAHGLRVHTKKADVATARIQFADGSIATLTASRASKTKERTLQITENDKHISVNLATGHIAVHHQNGKGQTKQYTSLKPDPVKDELRAFIKAIKENKEASVSGEDGLRALLLAKQISHYIENQWI